METGLLRIEFTNKAEDGSYVVMRSIVKRCWAEAGFYCVTYTDNTSNAWPAHMIREIAFTPGITELSELP